MSTPGGEEAIERLKVKAVFVHKHPVLLTHLNPQACTSHMLDD